MIDYGKEKMDALVEQLKLGCKETRTRMIEGYMPLVHSKVNKWVQLYPGLQYVSDDMESEGYVAVVKAINKLAEGERPDNSNVTAYVSVAIINTIGKFLDSNDLIRIPEKSDEESPEIEPIFEATLEHKMPAGEFDVLDMLESACHTEEERAIVSLLARGYTERQIGSQLDMPQQTVNMLRLEIHERYTRLEQG